MLATICSRRLKQALVSNEVFFDGAFRVNRKGQCFIILIKEDYQYYLFFSALLFDWFSTFLMTKIDILLILTKLKGHTQPINIWNEPIIFLRKRGGPLCKFRSFHTQSSYDFPSNVIRPHTCTHQKYTRAVSLSRNSQPL